MTDAKSHAPIVGAQVTAGLDSGLVSPAWPTNHSGQYTLTLAAGAYDLTAGAEGYLSQTITQVIVISGGNTLQDFALVPLQWSYLPLVVRNP